MTNNLAIWDAVKTPDPRYTKSFTKGGGFSGTAINAVYLIERATELWGPMGGKWGVRILKEDLLTGAPIRIDNEVVCHELIHQVQIELFHPDGCVPSFGVTTFLGRNKYGPFTDEEAPKKSLTDALTKALSWLGFAADIHKGLFDDCKYVSQIKAKYEDAESSSTEPTVLEKVISGFSAAKTLSELDKGKADASMLRGPAKDQAREAYKAAKERILAAPGEQTREQTYIDRIDASNDTKSLTALVKYARADRLLNEDEKTFLIKLATDKQDDLRQAAA